jgi:phage baseplate assembly protein gpV
MRDIALDWLSQPPDTDDEEEPKRFYGVTVGTVINLADPMMLGRVQVQLRFIDDIDLSPWARVASPMAGIAHGTYFIPNIGDEVLVAFEHGDTNVPYILGSLWNGLAPPPMPTPLPQVREIRTLVGNQIMFLEAPPTIQIMTPSGQVMTLAATTSIVSTTGVQIVVGDTIVNITPAGVNITGKAITVTATSTLSLAAPTINITGGGVCNIKAPMVNINS